MNIKGVDFNSPTWMALADHAGQRLTELRQLNDSLTLDATQTAQVRGRIAVWKEFLALAQPAPEQLADVGPYC